jgi:hypothetical protein
MAARTRARSGRSARGLLAVGREVSDASERYRGGCLATADVTQDGAVGTTEALRVLSTYDDGTGLDLRRPESWKIAPGLREQYH